MYSKLRVNLKMKNFIADKILKCLIYIIFKLEICFGLSDSHNCKLCWIFSTAIKTVFVFMYPCSCFRILKFFTASNVLKGMADSNVTIYARNITFVLNWIFLIAVYFCEASKSDLGSSSQVFNQFSYLWRHQNWKENFILVAKCSVKILILDFTLLRLNYGKFIFWTKPRLSKLESSLMFFILLPYCVLSFATNRIYVANSIINQQLKILI